MIERGHIKNKKKNGVHHTRRRKPYVKPQLIKFGHIEKLTYGGTSGTTEGGGTMAPKP